MTGSFGVLYKTSRSAFADSPFVLKCLTGNVGTRFGGLHSGLELAQQHLQSTGARSARGRGARGRIGAGSLEANAAPCPSPRSSGSYSGSICRFPRGRPCQPPRTRYSCEDHTVHCSCYKPECTSSGVKMGGAVIISMQET